MLMCAQLRQKSARALPAQPGTRLEFEILNDAAAGGGYQWVNGVLGFRGFWGL